jgi:hypothetical protein
MAPTLDDGDDILVDAIEGWDQLRDGIYVLRRDQMLLVKRISMSPTGKRVTIRSDNPAYPEFPNVNVDDMDLIGRVVWFGRRVRKPGIIETESNKSDSSLTLLDYLESHFGSSTFVPDASPLKRRSYSRGPIS